MDNAPLILVHPFYRHYGKLGKEVRKGTALNLTNLGRIDHYLRFVALALKDTRKHVFLLEEQGREKLIEKVKEGLNINGNVTLIATHEEDPYPVEGWFALFDKLKPHRKQIIRLGGGFYWINRRTPLYEEASPGCAGKVHQTLARRGYKVKLETPLIFPQFRY